MLPSSMAAQVAKIGEMGFGLVRVLLRLGWLIERGSALVTNCLEDLFDLNPC